MKKILFIMLSMMVCVNGMYAQTDDPEVNAVSSSSQAVEDSLVTEKPSADADVDTEADEADDVPKASAAKPKHKKVAQTRDNMEELKELLREFNKNALAESQLETPDYDNMYVPIRGRSKFTRRNYITQRLEISILGGSDKAEDPDDGDMDDYRDDIKKGDTDDNHSFNMGLNVGYSLVFVPGHVEADRLKLNRMGFAYSLGFIASIDRQDKYGATCDLLGKVGIETGNGHAMGIGVDFLVGTGTSPVTLVFDGGEELEDYNDYDTRWCLKYGFQLWVRSNLLHANIKNTDIRLFARYVTSKDPTNDNDFVIDGQELGYYLWSPDSWQFGLTFCYNF